MKKIICAAAVLTVLAAVLVFVGCRKNGGEPSVSESAARALTQPAGRTWRQSRPGIPLPGAAPVFLNNLLTLAQK